MDDLAVNLCTGEFSSLSVSFNDFKSDYITAAEAIRRQSDYYAADSFTKGGLERCIETNTIWTLHWYPETPIGFCLIHGPTFAEVIAEAQEKSA